MKMRGFTIVELVIVITVIGILATIVIVAYSGVQNNANDKAVQSDLRTNAEAIENFRLGSATNSYPHATQADLQSILKFAKNAYALGQSSGSVSYCRNNTDYTIYGRSASKTAFLFSSVKGLYTPDTFTGNLSNAGGQCDTGGVTPGSAGFESIWLLKGTLNSEGGGWQSWLTLN